MGGGSQTEESALSLIAQHGELGAKAAKDNMADHGVVRELEMEDTAQNVEVSI